METNKHYWNQAIVLSVEACQLEHIEHNTVAQDIQNNVQMRDTNSRRSAVANVWPVNYNLVKGTINVKVNLKDLSYIDNTNYARLKGSPHRNWSVAMILRFQLTMLRKRMDFEVVYNRFCRDDYFVSSATIILRKTSWPA